MKTYKLHIVRHGITQGNIDGIYMGSGTDESLCTAGQDQLRTLRGRFAYPLVQTLFASPLKRAVESAEILFPSAANKIVLTDLRENHFGEFEGRKITSLVHDSHFKQWMDPAAHYTPVGGEPATDFHARCAAVLMQMFEYMMKGGVYEAACVTHGGVIMSMLAQRGMPRYAPEHWMADAGCGYTLLCSPEMWMRDGICEVYDIVPQGYLEDASGQPR